MSALSRNIEKLGHQLVDVRQRALIHLCQKLEHEIITIKELNSIPGFQRKLLEWFNFPSVPNGTIVLSLILKSTKINHAVYLDLGIFEFLEGLRQDLTEDEKVTADLILIEVIYQKLKTLFWGCSTLKSLILHILIYNNNG